MRVDLYLLQNYSSKYDSRTKATEDVKRGLVLINGQICKPSADLREGDVISFKETTERFVSNGGYKLNAAVTHFNVDTNGLVFADIGASYGGFTDCLLQHGAAKVYAIDVGESQLCDKLLNDNRVINVNNTNARYLTAAFFCEPIDGVVMDVSFISVRLILPAVYDIVRDGGIAFVLIKPQFECGKASLNKNGIVVDKAAHARVLTEIYSLCIQLGFCVKGLINAPIIKGKNLEYVLYLSKSDDKSIDKALYLNRSIIL